MPTATADGRRQRCTRQTGDLVDQMIAREVTVPAAGADADLRCAVGHRGVGWDFGFVQVSTDGGATWTSLPTADTTTDHDPDARPDIVAESGLPGFTGDSEGWPAETVDLGAYAGADGVDRFRYITDPFVILPGFWVDNVDAGRHVAVRWLQTSTAGRM